jgi:hypothetical protein
LLLLLLLLLCLLPSALAGRAERVRAAQQHPGAASQPASQPAHLASVCCSIVAYTTCSCAAAGGSTSATLSLLTKRGDSAWRPAPAPLLSDATSCTRSTRTKSRCSS